MSEISNCYRYFYPTFVLNMHYHWNCCQEVKQKVPIAKEAFNRKRSVFCEPLQKELRKRLEKYFVWSVALYGAEAWTLRWNEQK